jgi:hypothetical protein
LDFLLHYGEDAGFELGLLLLLTCAPPLSHPFAFSPHPNLLREYRFKQKKEAASSCIDSFPFASKESLLLTLTFLPPRFSTNFPAQTNFYYFQLRTQRISLTAALGEKKLSKKNFSLP